MSTTEPDRSASIRRNAPCPCGSGRKYKHCHGGGEASTASTAPGAAELDLAISALQTGRHADARRLARAVLAITPNDPTALNVFGVATFEADDDPTGLQFIEAAIEQRPDYLQAHMNLGNLLKRLGRLDDAVAAYERALSIEPDNADVHYNLGNALSARGDLRDAIAAYERALARNPDYRPAYSNLGYLQHRVGLSSEAIATFRRALELNPADGAAQFYLGLVLLDQDELSAARGAFEACVSSGVETVRGIAYLTATLQALGEDAAASQLSGLDRDIHWVEPGPLASFADPAEFLGRLAHDLRHHPSLQWEPEGKATTHGRRTGDLLIEPTAAIARLVEALRAALDRHLDAIEKDPSHPHFRRIPCEYDLDIWGIVLDEQGHQRAHIHATAWLSGVFYVQIPDSVSDTDHAGWIEFGRPADDFPIPIEPKTRLEQPKPGALLVFPPYTFHRTLPLRGQDQRISIAFDVRPLAYR